MIGKYHANVASQVMLKIKIGELNGKVTLYLAMDPYPISVDFDKVTVEGGCICATGKSGVLGDLVISMNLDFSGETFTGTLDLPTLAQLAFEFHPGEGQSLAEGLLEQVKNYRVSGVMERSDEDIAEEVEKLLAKMSVYDKVGQMSQCMASSFSFGGDVESEAPEKLVAEGKAGSILGAFDISRVFELQKIAVEQSPHRIPLLFNADVIHGHQTIFPVPLAWSCSWDMVAIEQACAIAAKEASASGITYNHGPMVDITRDPRWGRVVEGAGEDPYLGSLVAEAQVKGFQGDGLFSQETIIACLKHFIAYGAAEAGRDYNTVDISEGTLRNVYLPPFRAGIEAGAGSVMNSFNIYQGIPVAANKAVMNDLLRKELGFDGILISDYGAIEEIVVHGKAKDSKEAAKKALDATMDIEMVTRAYDQLPQLVEEGLVLEEQLDAAVRRILTYKYKCGLMDDPFRYVRPEKEAEYHFHETHLQASRELASKSIVLLKNDGVLPLAKEDGTIAVIGPFGSSKDLLGPWQFSRYGDETVTLRQGLEAKGIAADRLLFAEGCGVEREIEGGLEQAVAIAENADIIILALGESSDMSGEAASRLDLVMPEVQLRLAEKIAGLGKPVVLVLTNGRPLVLEWFERHVDAIVETWFLGSQAGHAIADMLFGDTNPSGRLSMSFPAKAGQVPIYYNSFNTGRPVTESNSNQKFISKYIDGPNEPLYPFGYGLSYSTFTYSDIRLDRNRMTSADTIAATVTVTNTGKMAGEETVQLYIQDLYGTVVRPVKELKGFRKIKLQPGESEDVTFSVTEEELKYYTPNGKFQAEAGDFRLFVGPNSRELQAADFELV
ncbi:glycoside hydrolase family 3 N-terminal domain-containing protein [Bacillus sp. FJAT-28004]|uniref:glycoside hydrolase family 3 N-terminal domain-containing protein n=1 Tax=Bacillus sp. FJAT-28004 TaxID=1679165 RepID=UPI0006B5A84E|nr:glycoside hydrolase family 3 N-terminal domain-containing protein [Bacillus sp. FJAT-28004]